MVVDLDRLVPQDHKLRKVDRVVDLSFVRGLTKFLYAKKRGRPSIDPELFLRMMIIRYLDGIASDRELCRQVTVNLAYRWYLKLGLDEAVPEHSSLTRIRDRLGEATFQTIFEKVVKACRDAGLVEGKRLMCDSTLIRADASLDSLKPLVEQGSDALATPTAMPKHLTHASYLERVAPAIKASRKIRYSNTTHRSATDPDARLVAGRNKGGHLWHKVQYSIDAAARIVTDCHVTGGSVQDVELLRPRVAKQIQTFRFALDEMIADRGYGVGETYDFLHARGVTTYIPYFDPWQKTNAHRSLFHYCEEDDVYVCPADEVLEPGAPTEDGSTTYRASAAVCAQCPLRAGCLGGNQKAKKVRRQRFQSAVDAVRRRMETESFKKKRYERLWKMEGTISEAKLRCGMAKAAYRGREKVQIQAYISSTVVNFKRVISSPLMARARKRAPIASIHRNRRPE